MTFQPKGSDGAPNMRADLDMLLSLRSQGLLPSIAAPMRVATPPYPVQIGSPPYASQHPSSSYSGKTPLSAYPGLPPSTASPASSPPNPRYAEHVGAAPSHTSPPSSIRARTYPPPSAFNHAFPSLKGLFTPPSRHGSRPTSPLPKSPRPTSPRPTSPRPASPQDHDQNIDPIADDAVSLGNRATALLSLFRPSSRTSATNHHAHGPSAMSTSASPAALTHGIGAPISSAQYFDETVRSRPSQHAHASAFGVDWSSLDGEDKHMSTTPSLPPPPRNHRRPGTGGGSRSLEADNVRLSTAQGNGVARPDGDDARVLPQDAPHTPPSLSTSSAHGCGASSTRAGRPPSVNSISSHASAERSENSMRRTRTVPKMLAPPTGPPPSAPSLRARTPSGPPSPIFEQDYQRQSGNGRLEPPANGTATWGAQHPYSKRVSGSSMRSVNTTSTGHSFGGTKPPPPPPRPPPNFAPPPAPTTDQYESAARLRESLLPRALRLSLLPPAAPPTQALPPRPDEPRFRHRRSNSTEAPSASNLHPIPGSPPPPAGPLPPTPDDPLSRSVRRRLRIVSTPAAPTQPQNEEAAADAPPPPLGEPILLRPEGSPQMFLNMADTPVTPAMPHSPLFLHVPSTLNDVEPTSLPPPPRRNSRSSKEVRTPEARPLASALLDPRDSAVVLEHH